MFDWLPGLTTRITKLVDHNPGLTLAVAFALIANFLPSCKTVEGEAVNPITGEVAPAHVIGHDVQQRLDALDAEMDGARLRVASDTELLERLGAESDELFKRGKAALDDAAADAKAKTAQRMALVEGVDTAIDAIPGAGPIKQLVWPIFLTLLGADNVRKSAVLRRRKREEEES